jgi:hypothetical protein
MKATTPWTATLTYAPGDGEVGEGVCAENRHEYYNNKDADVPRAQTPHFSKAGCIRAASRVEAGTCPPRPIKARYEGEKPADLPVIKAGFPGSDGGTSHKMGSSLIYGFDDFTHFRPDVPAQADCDPGSRLRNAFEPTCALGYKWLPGRCSPKIMGGESGRTRQPDMLQSCRK